MIVNSGLDIINYIYIYVHIINTDITSQIANIQMFYFLLGITIKKISTIYSIGKYMNVKHQIPTTGHYLHESQIWY